MLRALLLALGRSQLAKKVAVSVPATRRMVARFVPGETVADVLAAARTLADAGLYVSIDFLGEDTRSLRQADMVTDAYIELLRRIGAVGLADRVEVSVKLSALGSRLTNGPDLALDNAMAVCEAAAAAGTTVTVDAEDHTTTETALGIIGSLREAYPETAAVIQAYLRRSPDDCRRLADGRVRLCKGAYSEPKSVALQRHRDVDAAFVACMEILMRGGGRPMLATHDPRMITATIGRANSLGRALDSYEIQMLYGVRTDEQARLAALGHQVRVYVPFGTDWYGYFMRRLAERPANLLFFFRALASRPAAATTDPKPRASRRRRART